MLRLNRSILITLLATAFLGGLLLARARWQIDPTLMTLVGLLAIPARRTRALPAVLMTLALSLGIWRGQAVMKAYQPLDDLFGQKVTVTGSIADDPAVTEEGNMEFAVTRVRIDSRPQRGQIKIRSHHAHLQRGYLVEATGKLRPALGSRPAQISFASLTVLSSRQSVLEQWRQRFFAGLRTALPNEAASLGLGLLVGARSQLPETLQNDLAATGLAHLIAVSGYNLTIMVQAARRLLATYSRRLTILASFWLIGVFVAIAGASASIVRAAIVSILLLLSGYAGRRLTPVVVIALAAVISAGYEPYYLWRDLGWRLSFLAFFGIMVLAPTLARWWFARPNAIKALWAETLGAHVMTLPPIAATFGRLSVIGPLANLLILPLIPLAMLLAVWAGVAGMLAPAWSGYLAWPARGLFELILSAVRFLAQTGWSQSRFQPDTWWTLAFYALIALTGLWAWLRLRRLTGVIIEPDK